MKHLLAPALALALASPGMALAEIPEVETPHGLARIEGTWIHPEVERLVIGDHTVVEPDPDSAHQRVKIEAEVGSLLLVGLFSSGNGCFDSYVWVHTAADEDLRTSEQFGTCTGIDEVRVEGDLVIVTMGSKNPNEGLLEYTYDGQAITERVLGQQASHSPPTASARNWIGHHPADLFSGADWRDPLDELIGEEAYKQAQDVFYLVSEDMVYPEGWISGMPFGKLDFSGFWGAVAINDDDRRLLVVLGEPGKPPRMWGDARGPLPQPIIDAIACKDQQISCGR